MKSLVDFIVRAKKGLANQYYKTEEAVRAQIVSPVLRYLGWDMENPSHVKFEHALTLKSSTKHVDIALFASEDAKSPRCIVEVKRVGRLGLEGEEQLFEYAFHSGVPVALLTDGAQWRFYITHLPGSYEERLVRLLDVERHPPDEIAEALLRYLSYENTRSDQARKNAEADLDQRVTRDKARKSIPQAWKQLTEDGEDDRLSRILIDATSSISEYAPARQDVIDFLRSLQQPGPDQTPQPPPRPRPSHPSVASPIKSQPGSESRVVRDSSAGKHPIEYWLLGSRYEAKNAITAYMDILSVLAKRDRGFLRRLEPQIRGKKISRLVRNRERFLPPQQPAKLPGGWWADKKLSNKDKMRYLQIACELAGIRFGDQNGLDITLPNALSLQTSTKRIQAPKSRMPSYRQHGTGPTTTQSNHEARVVRDSSAGTRATEYWLLGSRHEAKNAATAYVNILSALAERNSGFLQRLEPQLQGREKSRLVRNKERFFRHQRPAGLPGGWWADTNLSNKDKLHYLKIACELAGIRFGDRRGLDITLPNT